MSGPKRTPRKDAGDDQLNVGLKVRHTRMVKGLTLKQLASAVGCSESLLSKIENGRSNPSLKMIQKLARGLDMTVGALFALVDETDQPVTRAADRMMIRADQARRGNGLVLERLIPYSEGHLLQGNIHHLEIGGATEGLISHEGEEFGYVLEGEIELTVDDKTYAVMAGDSFFFRSERPHGYRNAGACTARVLWLNTPPSF